MSRIFAHQGNVRMAVEGTYGTAETTAATDVLETSRDDNGPVYTPTFSELDTLTPRRQGQKLVKTDEEIDYDYTSRVRSYTVPSSSPSAFPSLDAAFLGSGAVRSYDNSGDYILTYAWGDWSDAMEGVTVEDERLADDGTDAWKRVIAGARHNLVLSGERGGIVTAQMVGKAVSYVASDKGSAPASDDPPSGQVFTFEKATITLEPIGGSPSLATAVQSFSIDLEMNVQTIKTGGSSTGLIQDVLLVPAGAFSASVTIEDALRGTYNAEKLRDDEELFHVKLVLNDVSSADNDLTFEFYAQIQTVGMSRIAEGVMARDVSFRSVWFDASTPGVSPGDSFKAYWTTAAP